MLHFFNYLRLPAFSPPVVNRISRKSSWPCWNVCFLTLTATTRRGKQVERCREGWLPSDRCVRCFVLDVSLVVGVAEPVVEVAGILPVLVGDGGDGSQPCVVRHSKLAHSRDPRTLRRTWSLREVQSPSLPRPRRPHVRKTCLDCMVAPVLSISSTLQLGSPTVYRPNFEVTPVNAHVALLECC